MMGALDQGAVRVRARLWVSRAARAVTVLSAGTPVPFTSTSTALLAVVPSPNWPSVSVVQATAVPPAHGARQWLPRAAIAMTVLLAKTRGAVPSDVLPQA